jgi:hypothetical protein
VRKAIRLRAKIGARSTSISARSRHPTATHGLEGTLTPPEFVELRLGLRDLLFENRNLLL